MKIKQLVVVDTVTVLVGAGSVVVLAGVYMVAIYGRPRELVIEPGLPQADKSRISPPSLLLLQTP